jgi:hypothetical protein
MAKAKKQVARARKVRKTVTTMAQAVEVYGGTARMAKSFRTPIADVRLWERAGVPRCHHLGIMVGLEQRGYDVSHKLFGLRNWRELPGM